MCQTLYTSFTVNKTDLAKCMISSIDQFIKFGRTEIINSNFNCEFDNCIIHWKLLFDKDFWREGLFLSEKNECRCINWAVIAEFHLNRLWLVRNKEVFLKNWISFLYLFLCQLIWMQLTLNCEIWCFQISLFW